MNRLPLEQQFLIALQAAALAGLCFRVWKNGLYRVYRYLFGYLLLALLQIPILSFLSLRGTAYLYAWMACEALVIAFYALVVLETYNLILRDLPGIASAARRYIKAALAAAASISLLLVGLERTPATLPQYFLVCDRTITSTLLVFVLSLSVFLAYYPIPLNRNTVIYSVGFAVYLLAKTVVLLVGDLRYYWWAREVNTLLVGVCAGCLIFWLFTLSRDGEAKTVLVRHQWDADDERRILAKLQDMNQSLLRAAKK